MAKINIHIELDPKTDTLDALVAIAQAFGGKVELVTKETPKAAEIEKNEHAAEPEEPKQTKTTKKSKKAETKDDGIGEETTVDDLEKDDEAAEDESYTVDDVRTVMAEAKRSGKDTKDLRAILKANGAAVVSDLDAKKYASVIKAVKAL